MFGSCLKLFELKENVLPGADICLMYKGTVKFNCWHPFSRPSMITLTLFPSNIHVPCSPPTLAVFDRCFPKSQGHSFMTHHESLISHV